jgi:hypothetical protein
MFQLSDLGNEVLAINFNFHLKIWIAQEDYSSIFLLRACLDPLF